jgi:hypothetical protein
VQGFDLAVHTGALVAACPHAEALEWPDFPAADGDFEPAAAAADLIPDLWQGAGAHQ